MANVKLSEKKRLERLQAQIIIITGQKITQQELLDKCIRFAENRFQDFIKREISTPVLTQDIIEKIQNARFHSGFHYPDKSDDDLIYSISKGVE